MTRIWHVANRRAGWLIINHLDAWGIAVIIAAVALVVHQSFSTQALLLLFGIGLGYWFAFAINDYFDAPYDALEPEKAKRNYFSSRIGRSKLSLVFIFGIPFAILAGIFLSFGWRGATVAVVGTFIIWAYSAPPFRLKNRPGLDLLVHACFVETFPYAATLYLLKLSLMPIDGFILLMTALGSMTAQLEQQVRDFEVDQLVNHTTLVTKIGRRTAHGFVVVGTAAMLLVGLVYWRLAGLPWYLLPIGLIALPALGHRLVRGPERPRVQWLAYASAAVALLYMAFVVVYQALAHWRPI